MFNLDVGDVNVHEILQDSQTSCLTQITFSKTFWYVITTYLAIIRPPGVASVLHAPNTNTVPYIQEGDLNIGGLYSVRSQSKDMSHPCGAPVKNFRLQQNIEAMVYAIQQINQNPDILPGINLGYVILDDCRRGVTTLSQAVRFAKPYACAYDSCTDQYANSTNRPHYDVVGVVGPTSSSRSLAASSLLSLHHIPIISPEATSDELSDKEENAYFLRVIPPNKYQASAIAELIIHFNWTYVSLLYSEEAYGTNIAKLVRRHLKAKSICIGYQQSLEEDLSDGNEYDRTVVNLRKFGNARAVILVLKTAQSLYLMEAIRRAGATGEFIWIGSETFDFRSFRGYEQEAYHSLSLAVPLGYDVGFGEHYLKLNPETNKLNPWYPELWQNLFKCSWKTNTSSEIFCGNYKDIAAADDFYVSNWTSLSEDAVWAYAHALHALIQENCLNHNRDKKNLRKCVTGELLLTYLKNVSFQGLATHITFDNNGDLVGNFIVKQLLREGGTYIHREVGTWQRTVTGGAVILDDSLLSWQNDNSIHGSNETPDSICSWPCDVGQIYIQGEVICCWQCHTCRDNEIVDTNGTHCSLCPKLSWPNMKTKQECNTIRPTFLTWLDPFGIGLTSMASVGVLFSMTIILLFTTYNKRKIVKASCIELTSIILTGLLMAYLTVYSLVAEPNNIICSLGNFGFHLSCTLVYSPLLVKTSRVYRIFRASKHCRRPTFLMSMKAQIGMVIACVLVQLVLIVVAPILNNVLHRENQQPERSSVLITSAAKIDMPVLTQRYVELFCDRPEPAFFTPLVFNILLLFMCAVFAFLTRKLPDAFNESWYIFLSVAATLFVWIAFLPTYFFAFFAYHRGALLALALILNGYATNIVLFSPKLYALGYLEDDMVETSSFQDPGAKRSVGSIHRGGASAKQDVGSKMQKIKHNQSENWSTGTGSSTDVSVISNK